MKTYTTTDIIKSLEIPRERLRDWISRKFINPSMPAPGQGLAAEFTLWDVYKVQAFRVMVEGGLSRETASMFLGAVKEDEVPLQDDVLIFRRSGKLISLGTLSQKKEGWLDLHTGLTVEQSFASVFTEVPKDWDDLYVMNFGKIRKTVDLRVR
jgi:hypothetical protein